MPRKYQGLIVLNTKALEGTIDELVNAVSSEIEAEGAKVVSIDPIGRRQFAYTSRHIDAGHYVNYTLESCPASIEKIQSRLKLNNHVHLQHYRRMA